MQKQYFYKILIKESEKNISQFNAKKSFTVTSSKHSVTSFRKKRTLTHNITYKRQTIKFFFIIYNILMGGMILSPIFSTPKNKVFQFRHGLQDLL